MGNVLLAAGLVLTLGARRAAAFFARRDKWAGAACLAAGVAAVLLRWPVLGVALELYGALRLFGDFLAAAVGFVAAVPVVGPAVEPWLRRLTGTPPAPPAPPSRTQADRIGAAQQLPV